MTEPRFNFGKNWRNFLSVLNDRRIIEAEAALKQMMGRDDLIGLSFLDVGCGSGLMSLAAYRLGAKVRSFDYSQESVACALELRSRFAANDSAWVIERGDVLDEAYLQSLGRHDVVYSWGVLHHTGEMWKALANVDSLVADKGQLFIAIYNDQGRISERWSFLKRRFNSAPDWLKLVMVIGTVAHFWTMTVLLDAIKRGDPLRSWRNQPRGMSPWYDAIDWIGGYPFEVAKPEEIFDFYRQRGYGLMRLKTCGGSIACNEFVFQRQ